MPKKATIKYRSSRSNLVHLPLSLYAQSAQSQTRPQGIILHLLPLVSGSSSNRVKEAYVGWSGLAAASSLGSSGVGEGKEVLETLEMDPEVAGSLSMPEGTIVEISIIHNPTKARSVSVTPLTSDDWEISEQNASFLEENSLSQLRAARKGQEIDVWVRGRTKIRIRVDDTDPGTNTAVSLNADTEVYVAPRPRGIKPKPQQEPTTLQPAVTTAKGKEKSTGSSRGFKARLVPGRVASQWGKPPAQQVSGPVFSCAHNVLERARRKFGVEIGDVYVRGVVESKKLEVGNATNGDKEGEEGAKDDGMEGFSTEWDEVPDGCVVLLGKASNEWEGWATIRLISASTPRKSKSNKENPPIIDLPSPTIRPPSAGVSELIEQAVGYLRRAAVSNTARPLLVTGAKGSGKTSLAQLVGDISEADRDSLTEVIYEDVARIDSEGRIGTIKEKMSAWIEQGSEKAPASSISDGIDTLLPPENELTPASNFAALSNHFCESFDASNLPAGLLVVVTATSSQSLHPMLNQRHVFGETVKVPAANKETRREISQSSVEQQTQQQSGSVNGHHSPSDFVTLGSMTEGYTAADLKDSVGGASQQAVMRSTQANEAIAFESEDFVAAQAAFTPSSLRGVSLQKSDVKWSDIGGLQEPRRVLRETLEWPTKYAQIFANCPLRLRSGLSLYGYPGCGKTSLASAVAKECGLNFISVKGPEILNKYIGASEKSVRDLFERASAAKPCVLFFDEFDSIAPKRGHDSTGVTDRVVNQLSTEMDGAQGLDGVYVLAATSRPDSIDSALLRPGRLDKSLSCDMPSKEDRLEIIRAVSTKSTFDPSIDFEMIAAETEGSSGADSQAVVYNAHLDVVQASLAGDEVQEPAESASKGKGKGKAVEGKGKGSGEDKAGVPKGKGGKIKAWKQIAPDTPGDRDDIAGMDAKIEAILANSQSRMVVKKEATKTPVPVIEQRHSLKSLANTRPSVSPADRARLHRIYSAFVADRDGSMPNGDMGRETGTRSSSM